MKIKRIKPLALLMASTIMLSSLQLSFATNPDADAEELQEIDDEEWEELKDQMTDFDDPDDPWDHETWDDEHKDLVWMVFCMTEWNNSTFPSLNFTQFGNASIDLAWLNEDDMIRIGGYIENYRFISGVYSVKDPQSGTVDNSAYVPLVVACMDTLRGYGGGDDPYAIQNYVSGGKVKYKSYTTEYTNYEQNVTRLIFRKLVNAEKIYNSKHKPKSANIYNAYSEADGLLMMIQSVVLTPNYAQEASYSEDSASAYFDKIRRGNQGYSKWNNFASTTLSKYHPTEVENQYIMDAFGERIKVGTEYDDKGNEKFKKKNH